MERSLGSVLSIGDDAHQFRISTELAVNLCFTAHALNARAEAERRDFQNERVARNDRPPKARFLDAREKHQLLIAIGDLAQRKDGAACASASITNTPGITGRPESGPGKKTR